MAAPELRLNVTLDLPAFRAQLGKLAQASAAYYYPVNLQINKKNFEAQLKALSRIKPVINIEDSQLIGARARIATLNKSLATLRRATATPIEIKIKYTEVGKAPSGATGQIAKTVSGGIRAEQALQGLKYKELQSARKMMSEAGMPVGAMGKSKSTEAYMKSLVEGMKNAGEQSIAGLAQGLKDGKSAVGQAAKGVGESGLRALKDFWGIASPSRVFKQIGEFAVDGLEIGFLNGLKDFKNKSVDEVRKITALLRLEFAKVQNISGMGGPSMGNLRRQLVGQRAYTSPIGPQPLGSRTPWAAGSAGQFGASGYEPRMVSRPYGQAYPAQSSSFLNFSRSASQVQPSGRTPGTFLGFSQRAAQVTQATQGGGSGGGGGGGGVPPRSGGGFNFGPNMGRDLGRGLLGGSGGGIAGEIASEFAQATKQVLLFGTAYKALAAITALPGNIINATANLQSFHNQLEAVTGGGKIMTDSLSLIEDTVARFNMPIESARQGFVRLYASMAPAGISGGTINSIFTGLAGASTTLGMSSDQVDRMTYALSQMASKGQITSEELKGQLGDVFPQAVSLFAEAAGFLNDTMDDQAKAKGLSSFLAALEDGALRGEAMSKVLTNVGVLLNQDFGPTGEKAAASFRGQIIALNNALTSFYESFAPAASQFLGQFVQPIIQGLVTVGNAVKLALSGETITNNPLASYFKNELFPQLENIKTALLGTGQVFAALAQSIGVVLRPLAQFVLGNQTLVSSIAKGLVVFATFRAAIAALNALGIIPLIANIVRYGAVFRIFITQTAAGATGIRALNTAMTQTGLSATAAIGGIRALAATIRTALVTSAIGIAIVAIGALIEQITQLQAVADSVKARGKGVSTRLTTAAKGGTPLLKEEEANINAEIKTSNRLRALYMKGTTKQGLTESELKEIEDQGGDISMFTTPFGGGNRGARAALPVSQARYQAGLQQRNVMTMQGRLQETLPAARQNAAVIDRRNKDQSKVNLTGLGTDLAGVGKPEKPRESQIPSLKLELDYQRQLLSLELETSRARILDNNLAVIRLEGERAMLDLKREALQVDLEDLTPTEKKIKKEAIATKGLIAAEKTRNDMALELAKILEDHDTQLENIEQKSQQEITNRQSYLELLSSGIKPTHAKIVIEVENEITALKEALSIRRLNLQEEIKLLKAKKAGGGKIDEAALSDLEKGLVNTESRIADLPAFGTAETARRLTTASTTKTSQEYISENLEQAEDKMKELTNMGYQLTGAADAIGSAFGEAFKGIVSGSMTAQEALAGMFRSIADHFADMVGQIIAEWARTQLLQGLQAIFGAVFPAIGGGLSSGLSSGFNAGTASAIDTSAAGWGSALGTNLKFANGGIASGGFRAFANGGMVTGPTMGLVGEGRYNEAIIPLPDGKSVPVQLAGGAGGNAAPINTSIVVNVKNGQAESQMSGNQGNQLARELEGAVRQVILKESRPGGIIFGSR